MEIRETSLMKYLQKHDLIYYGKILDLKERITDWLDYIPQTFPHYTRHTIGHSEEIVQQLSKLLFIDDDPEKPTVRLSSIEVYILIAAALLHDAGMVTSDKEKAEILSSEAWKKFVSDDGPGAKRWSSIEEFRKSATEENDTNFLADVQTRYLIAEFIRRQHHERVANILTQYDSALADFNFGNVILGRTIRDICVSHGLRPHELADNEKFPERRDIRGETTNVRFLSILLRLGDLLDVDSDRACPLLLNAACPIPSDSLAHWTKYQRIVHRITAHDKIEITAECKNQDEHRFLQDWCQWLVDEVTEARNLMSSASRHGSWTAPHVTLSGDNPTIVIKPDSQATYIPYSWKFVLDEDIVFQRLIKDLYEHPLSFVRELIQNALDANRCQVYLDLAHEGLDLPQFTTQVPEGYRNRYPVKIFLKEREFLNDLSGETEPRQVLVVEDYGIGMDKNIIESYLLQVGRSYYTTDDFARTFHFLPSSRFGLGFLSVFAESDNVMVETFKPSSSSKDGPLRLRLTGPRNYLLIERCEKQYPGTRVEVVLKSRLQRGFLTSSISKWCRKVEFPVIVNDLGDETTISSERPEDFTYEVPDFTEEGARMSVKSYSLDSQGIEGEVYVFVWSSTEEERWDLWSWAYEKYPDLHPKATRPMLPENLICVNGIAVSYGSPSPFAGYNFRYHIDYRTKVLDLPISGLIHHVVSWEQESVRYFIERLLAKHLDESKRAQAEEGWKYKNRLIKEFQSWDFWEKIPAMIKGYKQGKPHYLSFERLDKTNVITVVCDFFGSFLPEKEPPALPKWDNDELNILLSDLRYVGWEIRPRLFKNRIIKYARWLPDGYLALDLTQADIRDSMKTLIKDILKSHSNEIIDVCDLQKKKVLGIHIDPLDIVLINSSNPLASWFLGIADMNEKGTLGIDREIVLKTANLMMNCLRYPILYEKTFLTYLDKLKTIPNFPEKLLPSSFEDIKIIEIRY